MGYTYKTSFSLAVAVRSDDLNITSLLVSWRNGDRQAGDSLLEIVYEQLRVLASRKLRGEDAGPAFQTSDLVNEVYIKLAGADVEWQNRVHFYALAARAMRRILIDEARARRSAKRGGAAGSIPMDSLESAAEVSVISAPHLLALDMALEELAEFDQRKSQLIELLYFGGLTHEEAGAALKISQTTLHRELKLAKAWLYSRMA